MLPHLGQGQPVDRGRHGAHDDRPGGQRQSASLLPTSDCVASVWRRFSLAPGRPAASRFRCADLDANASSPRTPNSASTLCLRVVPDARRRQPSAIDLFRRLHDRLHASKPVFPAISPPRLARISAVPGRAALKMPSDASLAVMAGALTACSIAPTDLLVFRDPCRREGRTRYRTVPLDSRARVSWVCRQTRNRLEATRPERPDLMSAQRTERPLRLRCAPRKAAMRAAPEQNGTAPHP
jgi:hypothetical protein